MSNAGSEAQDQPDLALDPSDPLNLLLNNSGTDSDSDLSQTAGPPDWSQLSSLWLQAHQPTPGVNSKPQDVSTMFDFPFPMDMELTYPPSIAMGVDPSMLYLDNNKGLHFSIPEMTSAVPIRPRDLLAESSLSSADDSSSSTSSPGSPSVGFGASPVVSHAPTHNPVAASYMPQATFLPLHMNTQTPVPSIPLSHTPSLPASSITSSPSHPSENASTNLGRPKTSHTTIERRYRTNLNARIQSLKAAVPALRVLDPNYRNDEHRVDERGYIDGVKVARKGSKANVLGKAVEYIQVLKRREARLNREKEGLRTLVCRFPNGETVLTQWEMEWVKKYGGPERDEIDNAGVEEASDEEDGDDDDDGSERARKKPKVECPPQKKEKRKIAPAVPATMQDTTTAAALVGLPEKRKRGRPRKIQPNAPPPVSASATSILLTGPNVASHAQAVPQTASQFAQPQQYLLAVFALISFFNSPLTTSMSTKQYRPTHEGVVLSHVSHPAQPLSSVPVSGWTWSDSVEAIHLLASALVIFSIVLTWIPLPTRWSQSRILRFVPFRFAISQPSTAAKSLHEVSDLPTPPVSPDVSDSDSEAGSSSNEGTVRAGSRGSREESSPLFLALNSKGSKDEYQKLIDVLEVNLGVAGLFRGAIGLWSPRDSEHRLKRQAWMRLAELIVLKSGDARVSVALRLQVYNNLSSGLHTSVTEQSPPNLVSDLCTLALLVYSLPLPFAQSRAERLWNRAWRIVDTNAHHVFTFERLIFKEMTLEGALECLSTSSEGTDVNGPTPITMLGSTLLHRRLLAHASSLFVHRVAEAHEGAVEDFSSEDEEKQWRETVEYGCSIDGDIAALCSVFKRAWRDEADMDADALEWGSVDSSLQALLTAIILHQQVFPRRQPDSTPGSLADFNTSFLSPPPSPQSGQPKDARSRRLRCILGSSVFEQSVTSSDIQSDACSLSLEDARDRVVDELVNLERETRRLR
ncbi:hypothetical protein BKA82DRAFT_996621 [Pisolithus tinctorius]|uniref:BHLH domain-containing protein n=1 Tax=Pisolithus tinctorius Marx 270 TaxID=870435 RepID=A0A0C3KJK9_PISTI|nr:hypothetical protein BKA82DRAFT_996621 [Pisolithus tinctorius]KIO09757.1 hypothetical protein M404DRAFT_996621 [Pisolithus tinctorius Marx 270]